MPHLSLVPASPHPGVPASPVAVLQASAPAFPPDFAVVRFFRDFRSAVLPSIDAMALHRHRVAQALDAALEVEDVYRCGCCGAVTADEGRCSNCGEHRGDWPVSAVLTMPTPEINYRSRWRAFLSLPDDC